MNSFAQFALVLFLSFANVSVSANTKVQMASDKLPNSLDAERSVLGAIVLNNGAALKVLPILRDTDFFLLQHTRIYRAMEIPQRRRQNRLTL